jgi:GNAT superfamily N-acetyltransferase
MSDVRVRPARPDDEPAVLELLRRSLGWRPQDPMAAFFTWKHRASPFGSSPAWVAESAGRVVGFRTFMRWSFSGPSGSLQAVRAVDTATDPEFQGRGIFRRLTLAALEEMAADGVAFVFNTPNDQSRPGYLKMGWKPVGRLPMHVRPRPSPQAAQRLRRARVPADRWSQPTDVGTAATGYGWPGAASADLPDDGRLRTRTTPDLLDWRYGFEPLRYRVLQAPGEPPVVIRLRRRGPATEMAVVHQTPARGSRRRVAAALRATGADYAVALGARRPPGFVTLKGRGPLLVARKLTVEPPPLDSWDLQLGDVELF